MLKKNLLSLAMAMIVLPLAACSNNEEVATPVETDAETVVVAEPEVMAESEPMAEVDPMDADMAADMTATQSIAEMAAGNENLTILTAALQAAGLDTMMMEAGEYTVFAPTDDAFAAVLTKLDVTKEELLANTDLLKSVLPYHVVPMVVKAADIPYGTPIETVNGQMITISDANVITDASGNMANIVGTDMMATNGVVHVIDTVLLPK
ncbi:fasciclin domain-containing protein [Psychrobacter sp. LV10R520-6]|uniref:fasciclin domain-containing protein n=1 Tax=Psychrobacter sp. LV10R520-6 TaxID=1415574 RepID=UPI0024C78A69|nr:fasciclin domain-containing protein [Psychrobacter sp. LV10R520-6]SNT69080.1 Uncaracterized surface protein containing fasciclin (FAS1) repeats [Psychrobacter sp. LV10R520-6]